MNRTEIYQQLNECIPELKRRDCTPRVLSESGVDTLLDSLIEIQHDEALDLLLDEQEVGFGL